MIKRTNIPQFMASLLMLVWAAGLTLTACTSNDDNPVTAPTVEGEDREVDSYAVDNEGTNDLAYFLSNFIHTDKDGKQHISGIGKILDEADPTVLSLPAESLDEAGEAFRTLIIGRDQIETTSTGNIVYIPTDPQGTKQGEIRLTPADDCIARITWSEGIVPSDLLTEVRFVDKKHWPDNGTTTTVKVGHYYNFVESFDDRPNYLLEVEKGFEAAVLCVEVTSCGAYFFRAQSSVPYSYDTDAKDKYGSYGVWYTDVKGKGEAKYSCRNQKAGQEKAYAYYIWPNSGYPQTTAYHILPYWEELYIVNSAVQKYKDSVKEIKDYFWQDGLKDKMFWTDKHEEKSLHFHYKGFVFTQNVAGSYRAYTNLGLFSHVYRTANDIPVRTLEEYGYYGYAIDPCEYTEYDAYSHWFAENRHYHTYLNKVELPF